MKGIGGEKCDQCARGFIQKADLTSEHPVHDRQIPHGEMPECLPCGECFTNWERILAELREQTDEQIARAEQVGSWQGRGRPAATRCTHGGVAPQQE